MFCAVKASIALLCCSSLIFAFAASVAASASFLSAVCTVVLFSSRSFFFCFLLLSVVLLLFAFDCLDVGGTVRLLGWLRWGLAVVDVVSALKSKLTKGVLELFLELLLGVARTFAVSRLLVVC